MGLLSIKSVPKALKTRTKKLAIGGWYYRQSKQPDKLKKIGFLYSLELDPSEYYFDFYYGFVKRKTKWEFKALCVISNLSGRVDCWGRNTFKDSDMEKIVAYEHSLSDLQEISIKTVLKLVFDLKLKIKPYIDILQLL